MFQDLSLFSSTMFSAVSPMAEKLETKERCGRWRWEEDGEV